MERNNLLSIVYVLCYTWRWKVSRFSRAVTAKKCAKKTWCLCKVVVLVSITLAFWTSSLPLQPWLLKLPVRFFGVLTNQRTRHFSGGARDASGISKFPLNWPVLSCLVFSYFIGDERSQNAKIVPTIACVAGRLLRRLSQPQIRVPCPRGHQ